MSLSDACSRGSIKLLDWIWISSCTSLEDRVARWSLTNYLRSDPIYYSFQFAKSVEVAADQGNMEIVEWLFAHFSSYQAHEGAVYNAAKNGHLRVLQFLYAVANENMNGDAPPNKKRKIVGWADGIRKEFAAGASNSAEWDDSPIMTAAQHGHFDVVRWLSENVPQNMNHRAYTETIKCALRAGKDELVQLLLPPGRCVLDYAEDCPRMEVIEWMMDCGYLHRDADVAVCAIRDLAGCGRLDLSQEIVQLHSPLPQKSVTRWSTTWYHALYNACASGALPTVQWLVKQQRITRDKCCDGIMRAAAKNGHAAVAQYLCEQKIVLDYNKPLKSALRNGHLKCVEVLVMQFVSAEQEPDFCVIDFAAKSGYLEIVKFLDSFDPREVDNQNNPAAKTAWWSQPYDLLSKAAASGNVELVKWVHANREKGEGSEANAVAAAAFHNHLEVAQWLYAGRPERITDDALYNAAARGNLSLVRWLHSKGLKGSYNEAVSMAARCGHLDVVKWFYANRSERCTTEAINEITCSGPLRVADWLHTNISEQIRTNLDEVQSRRLTETFEMLLFVDAHCPQCFTPAFVDRTKRFLSSWESEHELRWLEARLKLTGPDKQTKKDDCKKRRWR